MRRNEPVTHQEKRFPDHFHLITTTSLDSKITAVNDHFLEVAGYTREELLGEYHNIIRHPDMPSAAFEDMWTAIQRGESWKGLVKNRCKNGDYYWVDAFVTPIRHQGKIVEYQSVRTCPSREQVARAEKVYSGWRKGTLPRRFRARRPAVRMQLLGLWLTMAIAGPFVLGQSLENWLGVAGYQALLAAVFGCLYRWARPLEKLALETCQEVSEAMPYIYTGCRDVASWISFDQQKKESILRAVSARMHSNAGDLQGCKDRAMQWVSSSVDSIRSQQNDIRDISQAFNELALSVDRVAELATNTHESTENATRSGEDCRSCMQRMISAFDTLSADLKTANESIAALSSKSDAIGMVLEVITDIAEQTNLLALNAAIEAARAGDAGRGFAVVADEVRGLAKRTHTSTQQIEEIIGDLQSQTQKAVDIVSSGVSSCESTSVIADEAHQALESTLTDVRTIASYAQEVASATEEQSALSAQVGHQATRLLELSEAAVKSSEGARSESEQLAGNVDQVHLLARHFLQMRQKHRKETATVVPLHEAI